MTLSSLINELNSGKTFEQICKEQKADLVECSGNIVYEDMDLENYLESLGAEIDDFCVGYAIISTEEGKTYEVPYEDRPNRFGPDLPEETVLDFDPATVYEV